jgi:DNA-directed RNA polymerase specialized sigma24 family protein
MMTPSDRTLIELVDLEGHTLAEAANILGRSFEAVKKQHGRALRRFEDLALRYVGDEPPCDE